MEQKQHSMKYQEFFKFDRDFTPLIQECENFSNRKKIKRKPYPANYSVNAKIQRETS